jgi:hypothetical protein
LGLPSVELPEEFFKTSQHSGQRRRLQTRSFLFGAILTLEKNDQR